jgi:hypothetical protein
MTIAVKPSDKLAKLAARNAMLLLSLASIDDTGSDFASIWRLCALKTLDAGWTRDVSALLSKHPDAVERFGDLPLRGSPSGRGVKPDFRRELFALLDRHCFGALYLSSDGASCPLRLLPHVLHVQVGGRSHVGRWGGGPALCRKLGLPEHFQHYIRRLGGATAAECCRQASETLRAAELAAHKKQERRIRELVDGCCAERRPVPRTHARRAIAI